MTDKVSTSNKATTGHGCCCGDKVEARSAAVAVDPVCGMTVSTVTADKSRFEGTDFFFCSSGCHAKFDTSPATFFGNTHQPMERHHG